MDPLIATILLGGGIGVASYILGRRSMKPNAEDIKLLINITIDQTILDLIDNGYIKYTQDSSGKIVFLKADQDLPE